MSVYVLPSASLIVKPHATRYTRTVKKQKNGASDTKGLRMKQKALFDSKEKLNQASKKSHLIHCPRNSFLAYTNRSLRLRHCELMGTICTKEDLFSFMETQCFICFDAVCFVFKPEVSKHVWHDG
jgi:hypothetical protein